MRKPKPNPEHDAFRHWFAENRLDRQIELRSGLALSQLHARLDASIAARALLAETLETLSNMTTDAFSTGGDRDLRRKIASHLGLDPGEHSL